MAKKVLRIQNDLYTAGKNIEADWKNPHVFYMKLFKFCWQNFKRKPDDLYFNVII